jgi:hypothetical protein
VADADASLRGFEVNRVHARIERHDPYVIGTTRHRVLTLLVYGPSDTGFHGDLFGALVGADVANVTRKDCIGFPGSEGNGMMRAAGQPWRQEHM